MTRDEGNGNGISLITSGGSATVSVDSDEIGTINTVTLDVDSSTANSTITDTLAAPNHDVEFEFSAEFELGLEQTVVCHHCGEVNAVPDAGFLTVVDADPSCRQCGFPLGVIRDGE